MNWILNNKFYFKLQLIVNYIKKILTIIYFFVLKFPIPYKVSHNNYQIIYFLHQ